ncbi:methyl-accepting chemotaxis protein [Herbaspirillum sp. DW155]|uniref:methyl-accepting chemotaxis protein n=1 Tax=Herbaspirillum sp. DW155 TaxID=3095609 RepID=UPI0030911824|nr:methyl-accepting chemotaxis protein [Herbaspirillum sp. DW155]
MSIARKLYLFSLFIVAVMASICCVNLVQLDKVGNSIHRIVDDTVPSISDLDEISVAVYKLRIDVLSYVFINDDKVKVNAKKEMEVSYKRVQDGLERYKRQDISDEKDRALFVLIEKNFTEYNKLREQILEQRDPQRSIEILLQGRQVIGALVKSIEDTKSYNQELARQYQTEVTAALTESNRASWMASILAGLLVLFISVSLARQISTRLRRAVSVTEQIGAGRLTTLVETAGSDEIAKLMHSIAAMRSNLEDVIAKVQDSADAVTSIAAEISNGNLDLSNRTEKQAASLEETASSMEELLSAVKTNSTNARQASTLAVAGSDVAHRSSAEIQNAVNTMHEIASSSGRMSEIIAVIEGISFQTNILALNAAVEAARAGENGRGFAVVASEVRALAQRSTSAAKEIKDLIVASVEHIQSGKLIVEGTVDTISQITSSAGQTRELMHEIANASEEQSSGISQINDAIVQIDQNTQQNAALVEQIAAASNLLKEQAVFLQQTISFFETRPQGVIVDMEGGH